MVQHFNNVLYNDKYWNIEHYNYWNSEHYINETKLHNGTYFAPINQLISHQAFTNHGFHFKDKIARISKPLSKYFFFLGPGPFETFYTNLQTTNYKNINIKNKG